MNKINVKDYILKYDIHLEADRFILRSLMRQYVDSPDTIISAVSTQLMLIQLTRLRNDHKLEKALIHYLTQMVTDPTKINYE